MARHLKFPRTTIHHGDCLDVLRGMADASVDAVVTDPPYELGFMGRKWDASGIAYSVDLWREVLRVLKPGGHLLAFGGTRTYHRMTCAIEDAGFEIRDTIAWMYGQGFPKSHNLDGAHKGWGTALKPAHEPVTVARKPLVGTVAANVLAHGTGAINVDGCRVGASKRVPGSPKRVDASAHTVSLPGYGGGSGHDPNVGRWPANVVLDEFDDPVLRLTDNADQQVARVVGLYFDEMRGVLGRDSDIPKPGRAKEVLQPGMLRGEPSDAHGAVVASVRGCAHLGGEGTDGGLTEGEAPDGQTVVDVEGRTIPESRIRDDQRGTPNGARTDVVCSDDQRVFWGGDPRAPAGDGAQVGPTAVAVGDRSPSQRCEVGQQNPKPGTVRQRNAQARSCGDRSGTPKAAQGKRALEVRASEVPVCWLGLFEPTGRFVRGGAAAVLDAQSGVLRARGNTTAKEHGPKESVALGRFNASSERGDPGDSGGASRFFYCAKASRAERNAGCEGLPAKGRGLAHKRCAHCGRQRVNVRGACECPDPVWVDAAEAAPRPNHHPTVKPLALMRWLVRLVTPPGGTVLDPFAGSGTTLVAAKAEGFHAIGIEREAEYVEIIKARLAASL